MDKTTSVQHTNLSALHIIKATAEMHAEVVDFYYQLIDDMKDDEFRPKWEKGVYPSEDFLLDAIKAETLFLCLDRNQILAAMILNNNFSDAYRQVNWNIDAANNEILIIHTLAVAHNTTGRGIGSLMVNYAFDYARSTGCRTVRLDVLIGNPPAKLLYEYTGFQFMGTVSIFYEDTGNAEFELFEYVL